MTKKYTYLVHIALFLAAMILLCLGFFLESPNGGLITEQRAMPTCKEVQEVAEETRSDATAPQGVTREFHFTLGNNLTEKQLMFYVINSNTKVYINGELVFDKHRSETNKVSATGCYWVNLTLLRGTNSDKIKVTATRDVINVETVKYKVLENQIGYISISEFDSVTGAQFAKALKQLQKKNIEGLVVDLRNNPGGSLSTVCDILDSILPKGLIVYTKDKNGKKEEYTSDEKHRLNLPMSVLVNGQSASASEIFAGAVQDYGKAEIIGTQTYGKGVVQNLFDLKDGTSVKLTIAEYLIAGQFGINGKGVTPDVEVQYEKDAQNPDRDNQLEKALEEVKNKL